ETNHSADINPDWFKLTFFAGLWGRISGQKEEAKESNKELEENEWSYNPYTIIKEGYNLIHRKNAIKNNTGEYHQKSAKKLPGSQLFRLDSDKKYKIITKQIDEIINLIEDVMKEHVSGINKNEIKKIAEERFETLNLPKDVLQRYPIELSGGMKQRTVIAISTILNPKILIADEPTSALDVTSQKIVIKLLKDLIRRGFIKAMVFITHELPLLYNIADDIMVMYAGEIVESGEAEEVIFDPIHPYSNGLMNSIIVPEKGIKGKKLTVIPGAPPNLKYKLDGCRFFDRCLFSKDECKISEVSVKYVNNRSYRCVLQVDELKEMYEDGKKRATT
ncbi:MAG: peptide/nickel transport system ATP-binding protein, partial [Thermoanaerobacterium sp.]|nr:peptide/nickel transport system ATP-binding protein [Thermoanaerobacterium sp.]